MSIWAIRALVTAAESSGVERTSLLRQLRLSPAQLADDTRRVPYATYGQMVRTALAMSGDPALGLHMAEEAELPSPFDAPRARTLRRALSIFDTHALLATDSRRFALHEHGQAATIRIAIPELPAVETRFFAELATSALHLHVLRARVGPGARPTRVHFPYPAPRHRSEYTRIFRGAEAFDEGFTGVTIDRAWLEQPSPCSPELRAALHAQVDALLAQVARGIPATDRVKRWLSAQDLSSKPLMQDAARALDLSPRSLRRLLGNEATDFTQLLEAARAERAVRLLASGLASVQEVSCELGFTTHGAFTRAFKRWTGTTPSAFRSRH